jgi:type VI secretion system secreted protein VgrG
MTDLSHIQSLVANLFGSHLSQHARLLTLESAQGSDLPESLVVERFVGREAVNELFRFDIDTLSVSATLDLTPLVGQELTLRLLQPDGSRRAWHGFCTQARRAGANGGLARYRLRLEPGLSFLDRRRDSYLFQDKHAADIISELLADYPQVPFRFDISQPLAVRPICTQFRESDLDFFQRLLTSEGLSFRFTHDQDAKASVHAKHQLVIFDSHAQKPGLPVDRVLRFHGVRAADTDDAINRFCAQRQVQPNAVALSSWDAQRLHAPAAEQMSSLSAGELPSLSIHDGSTTHRFDDIDAASRHAKLALAALELHNKTFTGAGSVRRLVAGHAFTLTQHDAYGYGEDAFTVLWVEHAGANNLEAQTAAASSSSNATLQRGTYRNTFGCLRECVPIVPGAVAARRRATASGAQPARVVGLPDAALTTNRDHQVKVQFPWQRGDRPNPGGLSDPGNAVDTQGNAPGDHTSGTWVRVAEALAGPNWGTSFLPRIGGEVLVDFIEGDMDRPVIVAQLYTGVDLPPYTAGVDSGINHAGVISGLHSKALHGPGYNQWVIDDTQGQLRMRLATSTAASQLNLGYLIAQSPSSAQRGQYRGAGFELRTDGWGVLRAGEGMLVSTTARPAMGASVTSTQMDVAEGVAQLKDAQNVTQRVCEAATQQKALVSKDANEAQQAFIAATDPEQGGKYASAVNGHAAQKAGLGSRELDAPVEKFAEPLMLLDAPSTINWASPASSVLFAGGHLHWSTQGDVQMTAAHTAASVSGNATTLFTHDGGLQAIAANGPVSLAAHTDSLEMLADQAVTVQSVNGHIRIEAARKIAIVAGQSSVTLEGGNITFACPGQFSAKGAQRVFAGPASKAAALEVLPDTRVDRFDQQFRLVLPETEIPITNQPYRITTSSGEVFEGVSDGEGMTERIITKDEEFLSIEILESAIERIIGDI